MRYLIQNCELVIQHWPGKGAWTYHLAIPNSRDVAGIWPHIAVAGTIDGLPLTGRHLLPRKNQDKLLSLSAALRRQLGKQAGDTVRVTLYLEPDNRLQDASEVRTCLEEAGVLRQFNDLPAERQRAWLQDILAQPTETQQEKKLLACLESLWALPGR